MSQSEKGPCHECPDGHEVITTYECPDCGKWTCTNHRDDRVYCNSCAEDYYVQEEDYYYLHFNS